MGPPIFLLSISKYSIIISFSLNTQVLNTALKFYDVLGSFWLAILELGYAQKRVFLVVRIHKRKRILI